MIESFITASLSNSHKGADILQKSTFRRVFSSLEGLKDLSWAYIWWQFLTHCCIIWWQFLTHWPYQISKIKKDIFLNIIKLIKLFLTFLSQWLKTNYLKCKAAGETVFIWAPRLYFRENLELIFGLFVLLFTCDCFIISSYHFFYW